MPNFRAIGLFSGEFNMKNITNSDWKAIPGFPNYAITPDGQVWSYYTNKFLKLTEDKKGYLKVNLSNDLGITNCKVHRLVGKAFVKLPEEFNGNYDKATIDHIDGNKLNNHYTNLEWVTRGENSSRAWENGLCDNRKKECSYIDSLDNSYHESDSTRGIDKELNLPIDTAKHAIRRTHGLIRGRYIAGYLNDVRWKGLLAKCTVEQIVESYADQIERYKWQMGPKKITNIQTGESKVYNSLSEFARENGLDPDHITRYLRNHSDLYKVELV